MLAGLAGDEVAAAWFAAPSVVGELSPVAAPAPAPRRWIVELSPAALAAAPTVEAAAQVVAAAVPGAGLVRGLGSRGQLVITAATTAAELAANRAFASVAFDDELVPLAVVTPNDPRYASGQLWGLNNTGITGVADADIDAPEAWSLTTGSADVVVAVIDGGIDTSHPDLAPNIWANPGEIAGNRIDDDANGFVDDVTGWDFANRDGSVFDVGDNEHATHVAGTIAARGNDGRGVVGVSWLTKIMPLKFISPTTSFTSDAIAALNYAVMMRQRGVNIRVVNTSWGSTVFNASLEAAINRAGAAGIIVVASAGNFGSNDDATSAPNYPSSYDSPAIVSVAASDAWDQLWTSSNYGRTRVDLAAPGVTIVSTVPGNAYAARTGTSMAAAFVSGTAALAVSINPGITVAALRATLLEGVDPQAALSGQLATGGRLNAARTVRLAASQRPIDLAAGVTLVDNLSRIGAAQLVKRGAGTAILTGSSTHSGGTVVEEGVLIVRSATALGTGPLTVAANARVVFEVGAATVSVGGLGAGLSGAVDVGGGRLVIAAGGSSLAAVRGLLQAGYASAWGGSSGLVSRAASGVPSGGLGYVVDDDGRITVGFAVAGDTNLDGEIDVIDVATMLAAGAFNTGVAASWADGDFNYDGVFDVLDVSDVLGGALVNAGPYAPAGMTAVAQGAEVSLEMQAVFAALAGETTSSRRRLTRYQSA
jgi:autotransporter-associated beta strand protein